MISKMMDAFLHTWCLQLQAPLSRACTIHNDPHHLPSVPASDTACFLCMQHCLFGSLHSHSLSLIPSELFKAPSATPLQPLFSLLASTSGCTRALRPELMRPSSLVECPFMAPCTDGHTHKQVKSNTPCSSILMPNSLHHICRRGHVQQQGHSAPLQS